MTLRSLLATAIGTVLVCAPYAHAQKACTPTSRVAPHPYPGIKKMGDTNNLAKPAGKSISMQGHSLILEGRLQDKHCNPIRDARIEIWHSTPSGKYRYANRADNVSTTPTFSGSGRTYSDSEGYFRFITLFPGAIGKRTPYVNIRVSSPDMSGVFQTQLFFANDVRNDNDRVYRWLSDKRKRTVTMPVRVAPDGGHIATATIVLPEKVGRLSY